MNWWKKNGSTVFSLAGLCGLAATVIFAIKETPAANEAVEQAKRDRTDWTPAETVKAAAPEYKRTLIFGAGTAACIVGAGVMNRKQQASLMSAYALAEQTYRQYKGKVQQIIGKDADGFVEKAIREEEKSDNNGFVPWDCVQTFYMEPYEKFFERTMEEVYAAEYEVNRYFRLNGEVTFNEFLDILRLPHVEHGDEIGWDAYDGEAFYGYMWIDFAHNYQLMDEMTVCCIEMPFAPHPLDEEAEWR